MTTLKNDLALRRDTIIPNTVEFESEYFGREYAAEGHLCGKVLSIFRDSQGDQYCAFEMADMGGVFVIHLGSRFFVGFLDDE